MLQPKNINIALMPAGRDFLAVEAAEFAEGRAPLLRRRTCRRGYVGSRSWRPSKR